jgi:predicted dienelactone hydrolase
MTLFRILLPPVLLLWLSMAAGLSAEDYNVGYRVLDFSYQRGDREITLTTAVWYPTRAEPARYSYNTGRYTEPTVLAVDAPVAERQEPFPVVFFATGGFGHALSSAFMMEHLAARGYVGVSIDYVDFQPPDYTREVYWGRIRGEEAMERHRRGEIKILSSMEDVTEDLVLLVRILTFDMDAGLPWVIEGRLKPTSFVLDRLLDLNRDPESFLHGALDASRIGISGHSGGGITLEGLIGGLPECTDERFKAAVIISAPLFPAYEENIPGIKIPIMVWAGDNDPAAINPRGSATARRDVYDLGKPPKYFLIVKDSDHFTFGNPPASRRQGVLMQEAVAASPQSSLLCEYTDAFFDKYLRGDERTDARLSRHDQRLQYYVREETAGRSIEFGEEEYVQARKPE